MAVLCLFTVLPASIGRADSGENAPETTDELRLAIAAALQASNTAGAAVVLVSRDKVLWTAEFGVADRATERPITTETMFRAGSISKSFVALAALRLQDQGRLQLDVALRELVGEGVFRNRWEASQPLQLVHLLEHTAGFDDVSLRTFAASVPEISHRDSLAFDPRGRTSRWPPGHFFSYSNVDYDLAAYALEEVTGQPFDEYMAEEVFAPLGMETATFLLTAAAKANLATGYAEDGISAVAYQHTVGRSSGALNLTPRELAHVVQMLLNRGTHRGVPFLHAESIDRMETPATTIAARNGVTAGYGLGNYTSFYKRFRFQGHEGTLPGFVAAYGYSPDLGVGYVLMLNSMNMTALAQAQDSIRAYLTRDAPAPSIAIAALDDERLAALEGYYRPHTFRLEKAGFIARLMGMRHIAANDGRLVVRGLGRDPQLLLPLDDEGRYCGENHAAATQLFVEDQGRLLYIDPMRMGGNFRRVPAWSVWAERSIIALCALLMLSALVFPLVWLPRMLLGRVKGVRHWSLRLLPLVAVLSLFAAATLMVAGSAQFIERFGNRTPWSLGFCMLTWLFALTTATGLVLSIRARRWDVNPWMRRHALLVSLANLVVLAYLAYWGIIGLRTWA